MSIWMLVLGAVLLLMVAYDAVATTITTGSAAGPVTSRVAHGWWWLARRLASGPRSPIMVSAGPIAGVLTVGTWLLLLWAGWALIFSADPGAVVSATTRQPADAWSRIYFAAFTAFTLGIGDYVPVGAAWQLLTSLGVVSGLALTTMAVTYLVPVVSAVTARRVLANTIAGMGGTPQEIVTTAYRGDGFAYLDHRLPQLADQIMATAERHLSYPVLHYFHSKHRDADFRVHLLALDEAVTIIQHGILDDERRPHPAVLSGLRHAVEKVILRAAVQVDTDGSPPTPTLQPLRDAGIEVTDDATFARLLEPLDDHRRRLAAFSRESLWHQEEPVRG